MHDGGPHHAHGDGLSRVADFLANVDSRIGADEGQDGGTDANDRTGTDIAPAAIVRKRREDGLGVRHGRDNPEGDNNA